MNTGVSALSCALILAGAGWSKKRRGWESNPPRPLRSDDGFEGRGDHQEPATLRHALTSIAGRTRGGDASVLRIMALAKQAQQRAGVADGVPIAVVVEVRPHPAGTAGTNAIRPDQIG